MTDCFSHLKRSAIMRAVKAKNTTPELAVRALLYRAGYRYRLHARDLPGRPDIVFRGNRKVIFVNGCFWHGHSRCRRAHLPSTRTKYWKHKIASNKARDTRIRR